MARDPIGFELTKSGDRRIVRKPDGRVSHCIKLTRADIKYLEWQRRNTAAHESVRSN